MKSLHVRLIVATAIILAAFLGLTGAILENAFRHSAESALRDRLQGQVYALLAAAEFRGDGVIQLPGVLPEARFSVPWSGIYAQVTASDDQVVWQSDSQQGFKVGFTRGLGPGESAVEKTEAFDGTPVLSLSFNVVWQDENRSLRAHTFTVAESLTGVEREIAVFRNSLWLGLLLVAGLLLVVLGLILRWGLRPLRQVSEDIAAIEGGTAAKLAGDYPRELLPLTQNLNALIQRERAQTERYQNTLGDLAHSLKTPLAVLQNESAKQRDTNPIADVLDEQLARMTQTVDYHLQRAQTSGRTALGPPVAVLQPVKRIAASLQKVFADKGVECEIHVPAGLMFRGAEGDLVELFGILLDNAYKWAASKVRVSCQSHSERRLAIVVEDDGPGIPAQEEAWILQRGARADSVTPGHGIGLAVVADMVGLYGGEISFARSSLGGAEVRVVL